MQSKIHVDASELKGRNVIDSRGKEIGEVRDVAIDPQGWSVTDLVVAVRKDVADDLRLEKPLLGGAALRIGVERIQSVGDTILLNLSEAEMRSQVGLGQG